MTENFQKPLFTNGQEMVESFTALGHIVPVDSYEHGAGKRVLQHSEQTGQDALVVDPRTKNGWKLVRQYRDTYGYDQVVLGSAVENGKAVTDLAHTTIYQTAEAFWTKEAAEVAARPEELVQAA